MIYFCLERKKLKIKIRKSLLTAELAELLINFVRSTGGKLEAEEREETKSLIEQFLLVRSMMLRSKHSGGEVRETSVYLKNGVLYFRIISYSRTFFPLTVAREEKLELLTRFLRIKRMLVNAGVARHE